MRSDERNGASVLERAFRLLDAFQPSGNELGLAELARRAELPKATAYRLAGQLVSLGALEKIGQSYRLGARLFTLGASMARQRRLREAALPFMEDLYETTHETINLGITDDTEVLIIERIAGRRSSPFGTEIGTRQMMYSSGLGKAILAFSPPELVKFVCESGLNAATPWTARTPDALYRELATILESGVAYDHEEQSLGVASVAAPLIDQGGQARAALAITGPTTRFIPERSAAAVRTAALALTRALKGYPWLE